MTTKTLDSPFGPVSFAVEDGFLLRVRFQADTNSTENDDPLAEEVARQLDAYFAGRLFNFDLPLAPPHSEFQAGIRQCMIDIPCGEMRTYGELAKDLGSASQAVGQACGANPIPIIVPCHRVVAAGGKLGGFSGGDGAPTKRKLLNHEAVYAP